MNYRPITDFKDLATVYRLDLNRTEYELLRMIIENIDDIHIQNDYNFLKDDLLKKVQNVKQIDISNKKIYNLLKS
jgi:hypothetical protein